MNKVILLSLSAVAVLVMSGCAGKDVIIKGGSTTDREVVAFQVNGMTKSSIINNTNTKLLQAVAEESVSAGYPYFTFNSPPTMRNANFATAEEFLAKCADKNFGVGLIPGAGLFIDDDCDMFSGLSSKAGFTLHKEKPATASLTATDVIATLKTKGLYKNGYSVGHTDSK